MTILYDHQAFQFQKYGGVSRYFSNILTKLPEEVSYDISIKYSDNQYLKNFHVSDNYTVSYDIESSGLWKLNKFMHNSLKRVINKYSKIRISEMQKANRINSIKHILSKNFDVFHPTYYDNYFLDALDKKPFVITVHDMTHELYPEFFQFDPCLFDQKEKLIKASDHIIAVSENTKKDIVDLLRIKPEKITVIHHANSILQTDNINSKNLNLPGRYLLFVGERDGYKNFWFFVHAVSPLFKKHDDLMLVCTGKAFNQNELLLFENLGISNKVLSIFVEESDLFTLYQKAEAFIYPSLNEGFGLPVLEAFQAKCPVILSNSSCFPEIAEDAAIYFDPKNRDDISSSIDEVISNTSLKEILTKKGLERMRQFTWDNFINKTVGVYKSLC